MRQIVHPSLMILAIAAFTGVSAQIGGRVIDAGGNPVSGIFVELIPAAFQSRPTRFDIADETTDERGAFDFEGVGKGSYLLAIGYVWTPDLDAPYPTTFYPNARDRASAFVFKVSADAKPLEIVFQLPAKMSELTVKGKILMANGKPAVDAHVRLHNDESNLVVSDCRTDENGNFFLKGFAGGRYHIEADNHKIMLDDWDAADSKPFTLDRPMKNFRLVLKSLSSKITEPHPQ